MQKTYFQPKMYLTRFLLGMALLNMQNYFQALHSDILEKLKSFKDLNFKKIVFGIRNSTFAPLFHKVTIIQIGNRFCKKVYNLCSV